MISRRHHLSPGDALDRRRLQEVLLQAASKSRRVYHENIANNQFDRDRFGDFSFEEYWYAYVEDQVHVIPHDGGPVPGGVISVGADEPFITGEISWSLDATPDSDGCIMIVGWPVFDGHALWAGESMAQIGAQLVNAGGPLAPVEDPTDTVSGADMYDYAPYNSQDPLPIGLGSSCAFLGFNGRSATGLFLTSIGKFSISNVQMTLRALHR